MQNQLEKPELPTVADKEDSCLSINGTNFQTWRQNTSTDSSCHSTPVQVRQRGRPRKEDARNSVDHKQRKITFFSDISKSVKRKLEDELELQSQQKDKQAKMMDPANGEIQPEDLNASTVEVDSSDDSDIMKYLKAMRKESAIQYEILKTEINSSKIETKREIEELRKDLQTYNTDLTALEEWLSRLEKENNSEPIDAIVAQKISKFEQKQSAMLKSLQRYQTLFEKQDWKQRKNKIIIKEKKFSVDNHLADVNSFLNHFFKLEGAAIDSKMISPRSSMPMFRVTLKSWKIKQTILHDKREALKDHEIYIEPDLSPDDLKIQQKLRTKAKLEKAKENTVLIKHHLIKINSDWFTWDEDSDE